MTPIRLLAVACDNLLGQAEMTALLLSLVIVGVVAVHAQPQQNAIY